MGVTVRDLLIGQQDILLASLGNTRALLDHPTEKGDATELDWLGVIDEFLPNRYKVARARVLDAEGNMSDVIDIVIFDRQYCPLWLKRGQSQYIPAESVYAVFEVKQEFNAAHAEYAGEKAASVRSLHRTNGAVVHAGGRIDAPKPLFPILAGLLTLDKGWAEPFGEPFRKALAKGSADEHLDIGCVLRHGSFDGVRDEYGAATVETSTPETALMFFLMRLFSRLQALGTVPVIDLAAYARNLQG
jgi:hypothetical protein